MRPRTSCAVSTERRHQLVLILESSCAMAEHVAGVSVLGESSPYPREIIVILLTCEQMAGDEAHKIGMSLNARLPATPDTPQLRHAARVLAGCRLGELVGLARIFLPLHYPRGQCAHPRSATPHFCPTVATLKTSRAAGMQRAMTTLRGCPGPCGTGRLNPSNAAMCCSQPYGPHLVNTTLPVDKPSNNGDAQSRGAKHCHGRESSWSCFSHLIDIAYV